MSNSQTAIGCQCNTFLPSKMSNERMRLHKAMEKRSKKLQNTEIGISFEASNQSQAWEDWVRTKYKWQFAIGTTSRVPGEQKGIDSLHYFIMDIDGEDAVSVLKIVASYITKLGFQYVPQQTKNGFHLYSNMMMPLRQCLILALQLGADMKWCLIAARRGYFFLADKKIVELPWPVERMIIHAKKRKA